MFGRWTVGPGEYAREVRNYQTHVGRLDWAAIQDWMCEPAVLHGGFIAGRRAPGTGLTILEHQRRTLESLLVLREIAPDLPWAPVLQGWGIQDYLAHVEMYLRAGINLRHEKIVGVGSVCRRQGTQEIGSVFRSLAALGLKLHGFGVKTRGLALAASDLASADSLAWSYTARRTPVLLPGCVGQGHKNCANCMTYALKWRRELLNEVSASA